ncbi:hypothetical protein C8Q73DRAFT_669616 [Cubamyces lactineus]|nr:hypothetical protein C8Q73DRAFT_669616 [Cubamyces lactineus]
MSSSFESEYATLQGHASSITVLRLALDVELRQFLEEHRMTPSAPRLWTRQFVDSLLDKNADYRSRVVDKVSRQARRLRKLTAPIIPERSIAIAELGQLYEQQQGELNASQRAFFDDLLLTIRQSHGTLASEVSALGSRFEQLSPILDFLVLPEDVLSTRMLTMGPYSTSAALQSLVSEALNDLNVLFVRREEIGRRAAEIEFNVSRDMPSGTVTDAQMRMAVQILGDLRVEIKGQMRSQNVALSRLQAEAATANSSPHRLPDYPDVPWTFPDLLHAATEYDSISRYCCLLEETL